MTSDFLDALYIILYIGVEVIPADHHGILQTELRIEPHLRQLDELLFRISEDGLQLLASEQPLHFHVVNARLDVNELERLPPTSIQLLDGRKKRLDACHVVNVQVLTARQAASSSTAHSMAMFRPSCRGKWMSRRTFISQPIKKTTACLLAPWLILSARVLELVY